MGANEEAAARREDELERLEEELVRRSRALDEFAEHVERKNAEAEAALARARDEATRVEASRLLSAVAEKRAEQMEADLHEERQTFLGEVVSRQKKLASVERERIALLEEAKRRLADSQHAGAALKSETVRLRQLRSQVSAMEEKLNSCHEEELAARKRLEALRTEEDHLSGRVASLREQLVPLEERIRLLETRHVDLDKLVEREHQVELIEKEVRALQERFSEQIEAHGGLAHWLHTKGRRYAEDAVELSAREKALTEREAAVSVSEVREVRMAERERRLLVRERRVEQELQELERLRADTDSSSVELDERKAALNRTEHDLARLKRTLEAREKTLSLKEKEVADTLDLAREEYRRNASRLAMIQSREAEIDAREKTLDAFEGEVRRHELQIAQERERVQQLPTQADRELLQEKTERLRGLATSLGASIDIVAATHALADEIAALPKASKHDMAMWESRLFSLLQEIQQAQTSKLEEVADTTAPGSPAPSSLSGKEFQMFRQALRDGRKVEDILSTITPVRQVFSEMRPRHMPGQAQSPALSDARSAPATL